MGTEHRLNRFRRRMEELQVPAAFLTCGESVRYLSGFSGSTALLVVTSQRARLVTDFRYARQAADECPHLEVHIIESSGSYREGARAALEELDVRLAAVEAEHLSLKAMDDYRAGLPGIALAPVADLVAPLRHIKDAEELAAIRDACLLADRGFEFILGRLRPGISERAVAAELEYFLKREGAEREAFDTIVASGPRSALPHGRASDRLLQVGDFITFDFGARVRGYNSDLTRTVVLGRADDRQREIHGIVLQALLRAREAIRPGASGTAVDAVARDFIGEQGYRENFGHGLGHGLGRLVHDHLGFSPKQDIVLEEGMVLTVEPGIYLDGWGGVRIEDDVLVTAHGCEVLTHAPRELIEVPV